MLHANGDNIIKRYLKFSEILEIQLKQTQEKHWNFPRVVRSLILVTHLLVRNLVIDMTCRYLHNDTGYKHIKKNNFFRLSSFSYDILAQKSFSLAKNYLMFYSTSYIPSKKIPKNFTCLWFRILQTFNFWTLFSHFGQILNTLLNYSLNKFAPTKQK